MPANHTDLEKRLWSAADELRANSKLKSSEYQHFYESYMGQGKSVYAVH